MSNVSATRNIVLVGMPGAGKSTVGVILAKRAAMDFVDSDVLIQVRAGRSLQSILDAEGYLGLRRVEEEIILTLDCTHHVIATGGSAVYSDAAMRHLKARGTVVFLDWPIETLARRIRDFGTRGIARRPDQDFAGVYAERRPLYLKYADVRVEGEGKDQDAMCAAIAEAAGLDLTGPVG